MSAKPHRLVIGTLLILILGLTIGLGAEGTGERSYTIPGHGALLLAVPKSWKGEIRQPPGGRPPTITLLPGSGAAFTLMITPLWNPRAQKDFNSTENVRRAVDGDRREIALSSVEKELSLIPLDGEKAHGYYFFATDKAPKPGEFKYLIRAGLGVGDLLLRVTFLSHEKNSESVEQALQVLRSARQKLQ